MVVLVFLMYAVVAMKRMLLQNLLEELKRDFEGEEYTRRLESRLRNEGYVALGVPGGTTTLMAAMMTASPEVVSMLLESGANVESVDVMGNDAFMFASIFGRPKNLQCWLERVKDWDLNRQNTVIIIIIINFASASSRSDIVDHDFDRFHQRNHRHHHHQHQHNHEHHLDNHQHQHHRSIIVIHHHRSINQSSSIDSSIINRSKTKSTINQSSSSIVNQSSNQSINQSINYRSIDHHHHHHRSSSSINQSINQSIDQSIIIIIIIKPSKFPKFQQAFSGFRIFSEFKQASKNQGIKQSRKHRSLQPFQNPKFQNSYLFQDFVSSF